MKAMLGMSAVLAAGLTVPGEAAGQRGSGEAKRDFAAGMRLAQAGGADLPLVRVAGVAGTSFDLDLRPPAEGARFIKIRNFPEDLKLSQGFRIRGSWIASASDMRGIRLLTPPGGARTVKLEIAYFRDNESAPVAQRVIAIDLKPAPDADRPAAGLGIALAAPAPPVAPAASPPPPKTTLSPEQEIQSLERATQLLRFGDIAAARLVLEDLAMKGSAQGARAMAETYDPDHLSRRFVAGLQPDLDAAKKWYRRAAEMGDAEASTRLSALD